MFYEAYPSFCYELEILMSHFYVVAKWNNITIFIRIVAAATINFSLAGVRLLIEGGSNSRAALIDLERHLLVTLTR